MPLIDELMPRFDEVERHEILVRAGPAALRHPRARRLREPLTLGRVLERGFVLLGERPERELVLGAVGRFWTPAGAQLTLDAGGFRAFATPGYSQAVWDFRLTPEAGGGSSGPSAG